MHLCGHWGHDLPLALIWLADHWPAVRMIRGLPPGPMRPPSWVALVAWGLLIGLMSGVIGWIAGMVIHEAFFPPTRAVEGLVAPELRVAPENITTARPGASAGGL